MNQAKLKKVLNKINQQLALHGGSVKLEGFDDQDKTVSIKLQGACQHCPMAQITSENFIKKELQKNIPEIKEIKVTP